MNPLDLERIRSALSCIPSDDRGVWVRMAMAVKSSLGDAGFEIWDAWSRQSDSYNAKDAQDVWRSCKANGGIGAGTLFHEAKEYGWRDNGAIQKPTPEGLDERRRIAAERAAREKAEKAREHAEAATKALAIWNTATPAQSDHPYLTRKQVSAVASLRDIDAAAAAEILGYAPKARDEPLTGRLLVVPIKIASELSTVELIDELGHKSTLYGGAKAGGYWEAQSLPDGGAPEPNLLVGEGVATVLSAKVASGIPGVAVLSCGNLEPVARAMRQRFPEAVLVILADLDKKTGLPNPHAIAAARAVGGRLALPDFGENRPEGATDFNDLTAHRGREVVQSAIASAKAPAGDQHGPGEEKALAGNSEGMHPGTQIHHDRIVNLRELFEEPEESAQWLVEELFPAGGFSVVAAKPKVGKSTLARQLALAVARGEPFLGRVTTKGPVLYVALEEKRSEVRAHFRAMGAATLARNGGYLWASLRAALAGYPALLAQVPEGPGPVDALPLGAAKLAVLKGRRVARQGEFRGAHEVNP